jgi:hypothetical protein
MDKAVLVGFLDLYRSPKPPKDLAVDGETDEPEEEKPEPLPRITMSELWPPSQRVKLMYIGLGFFLLNGLLICIWAYVLFQNR